MSDTNPTTPVRSGFDDPMNGTTAQDNTPKPSSSRQRRARSTSPASPSARGGRTGPNPESSLPPSATSSRGTSRSRQTRARTDSNTSDNIPDDDIKGFFDQGFSKMFHRSDALETKLDKLLESNKDLNKSLQGVTNSIEGMATSIVDALKLRTSGEQPKPNSEGQSSGKQPKPNSEGQSSDNTPPRQPTNPSQSSSNVWAEPVPSPPDRTPSHRNPQNVERSREIRDWVKELMGPDNVLLINVSKEEADSFAPLYKENSLAIPFNNDEQFRLYLLGEPASAWNKGAATVFTNWLLDNQKIAPQNRYEVDAIRTAFLAHIRSLHSKYVQSSKTLEEQDRKARKQTVDARKRNTYNMRGEAINLFEALQRFRKLWNILGVDGTSSDEEVLIEGQRQYQILNLHWRSQPFREFCRKLDVLYLSTRTKRKDSYGKVSFGRGAMPRRRLEVNIYTKTKRSPIMGLPINCYNPEWIKTEEAKFQGFTDIRLRPTSSIDFSLPEDLERLIELTLKGDDGDAV